MTELTPSVTKRKVTMTSVVVVGRDDTGAPVLQTHQAVDYVRPDFLDAYVEAAARVWQMIEVADEPDAGPAGFHGPTYVPPGLDTPLAGTYFPATSGSDIEAQLIESGDAAAIATSGSDAPVLLSDIIQEG